MARQKKDRNYYGVDQEKAVIMFLDAKTVEEREKIYREYLQEPINKMIESIIRTYKLYRQSYEFNDLHADTLSFLMTKFDKFKPEREKDHSHISGLSVKTTSLVKWSKSIRKTCHLSISTKVKVMY